MQRVRLGDTPGALVEHRIRKRGRIPRRTAESGNGRRDNHRPATTANDIVSWRNSRTAAVQSEDGQTCQRS